MWDFLNFIIGLFKIGNYSESQQGYEVESQDIFVLEFQIIS